MHARVCMCVYVCVYVRYVPNLSKKKASTADAVYASERDKREGGEGGGCLSKNSNSSVREVRGYRVRVFSCVSRRDRCVGRAMLYDVMSEHTCEQSFTIAG